MLARIGQRRGRSHPARVGCARATRRRVAPRRPRLAGSLAPRRVVRRGRPGGRPRRRDAPGRPRLGSRRRGRDARAQRRAGRPGRRARALSGLRVVAAAWRDAARRSRGRAARGGGAGGGRSRPRLSRRCPLRGRAHTRHRHAVALERPRAAGRGRAAQGRARARRLGGRAPGGDRAGLRALPPSARQRSQLVARALRGARAEARLPLDLLHPRGPPRPARRRGARGLQRSAAAPRARARRARARGRAARELQLPGERAAAVERARPSSRACSAGRSPATATTICDCPGTRASARSTGSASPTTRRSAGRSAPGRVRGSRSRSGPGTSSRAPRCASSSCRSC